MGYRIVCQLGRAGNLKNREAKKLEWNCKYGEENWKVVYKYKDKIMSRDKALDEYYNKSYYLYLKENPVKLNELCKSANAIYNPHAENTGGIDLQCQAVLIALEKLGRKLEGTQKIAIGTWNTKNRNRNAKNKIKYPQISWDLSPFKIPIWCDKSISIETFWQEYKYLVVKE